MQIYLHGFMPKERLLGKITNKIKFGIFSCITPTAQMTRKRYFACLSSKAGSAVVAV